GNGECEAQIGEPLHVLLYAGVETELRAEMDLKPDAVDRDTLGEQLLDEGIGRVAFWPEELEVEVVIEQLDVAIAHLRPAEHIGDEARAEVSQPDRIAECAVLVERLIENVPLVEFALEVAGGLDDVLAEDVAQLVGSEGLL